VSDPYIGEIRMVGFNFAPMGWTFCNGQLLPIIENDALFSLIGTTYGGDGQNTFAVPNLSGRIPLHAGSGSDLGQIAGQEAVTLTTSQLPPHSHSANASSNAATTTSPAGNVWASWGDGQYGVTADAPMSPTAITEAGGGLPHENRPPFLAINFVICMSGIYPSQN
jgi:microcystin-dependent protein